MPQRYVILFNLLLAISKITQGTDDVDETEIGYNGPLMLTLHENLYQYPDSVNIYEDGNREYFHTARKTTLEYFCPSEDDNPVDEYCLYKKTFEKKKENSCKKEVKPLIIEDINTSTSQQRTCETKSFSGLLYKFVHKVCAKKSTLKKFKNEMKLPEIQCPHTYEICYYPVLGQVIYIKHRIMFPNIIHNLHLNDQQRQHNFSKLYSTDTYGLNFKNFEKKLNAYRNRDFKSIDSEYELRMLVPIDDFALGHWMNPTLHVINHAPQHRSKIPVWDAINLHVRKRLIELHGKIGNVDIYTGTSGVLTNPNRRLLLIGNDNEALLTMPLIWWKLLYTSDKLKAILIIMHNVRDDDNSVEQYCQPSRTACDVIKWQINLDEESLKKNVYCCNPSSLIYSIQQLITDFYIHPPVEMLKLD